MRSVEEAIRYGLWKANYNDAREHQQKVIHAYCSGKDVFVSAPMGLGRSLTLEVAPYVLNYLQHREREEVSCPYAFLLHWDKNMGMKASESQKRSIN